MNERKTDKNQRCAAIQLGWNSNSGVFLLVIQL